MSEPRARFILMTTLAVGDKIAGGTVTSVRTSKSAKTVYVDYERSDGSSGRYSQSANTACAVFIGDGEPRHDHRCAPWHHQVVDDPCAECAQAIVYCRNDQGYHHRYADAPACFLINERRTDKPRGYWSDSIGAYVTIPED